VSVEIESALLDWEAGYRRLLAESDPRARLLLDDQVETIGAMLRRRLGVIFTIADLVSVYASSERWVLEAVPEEAGARPLRTLTVASDAAFHLYARGAIDYAP
jgi:hypothetical protein